MSGIARRGTAPGDASGLPEAPPSLQMRSIDGPSLGATHLGAGECHFLVWAPDAEKVEVEFLSDEGEEDTRLAALEARERGYHSAILDDVAPGARYRYRLTSGEDEWSRPDPASRFQPDGVHGPSQVVESRATWAAWKGLPLEEYVLYELHVGTFTQEGTFESIIPHLDALQALGITAIQLMPVGQFPGTRNWGYDGTYPYAVQNSYGGPDGLHALVDACHEREMAVALDVVYNHLGPEGNYLGDFGPYFTDKYRTPWGTSVNFDEGGSDEVRRFFIENALYWVREFKIDALRLDAVHAIFDSSALHVLEELAIAVHAEAGRNGGRFIHVIAESDLNDPRLVREREQGGFGLDAQWSDDFHHALHALVTGERGGYYRDFGSVEHLAEAFRNGYVYQGQASAYRERRHGRPAEGIPRHRFLAYAQNHDQVGNRTFGDRLSSIVDFEVLKPVAATTLLSPFTPLLFMGEEYGETAPFPYFVSHSDPDLVEAVRQGRQGEFAAFGWGEELPDPQAEATFRSAHPDRGLIGDDRHGTLLKLHHELIVIRRELGELGLLDPPEMEVESPGGHTLLVLRQNGGGAALLLLHFHEEAETIDVRLAPGDWTKRLDTTDERWAGSGSGLPLSIRGNGSVSLRLAPHSAVLFTCLEFPLDTEAAPS